jgi:outer membrane protein TolC
MLPSKSILVLVLCGLTALPGFGQTLQIENEAQGLVARVTQPYRPRPVSGISFSDTNRIERLIRAGTIYLSLRDAIALALENSLDIENARVGPLLYDSNLLKASAGSLLSNVNAPSISNGPSSASLGVLAGANALGAGSVSSSNAGQGGVLSGLSVQLAGSNIPNLDPTLSMAWDVGHQTSPTSSSFVTGTNATISQFKQFNFGIQKGFLTGTNVSLNMSNTLGLNQNSYQNNFNPTTNASLSLTVSQNLLQGFGTNVNSRVIRVAKNQRRTSDLQFKQQVIATVSNVVGLYWDLVSFNESLNVYRQTFEIDTKQYNDNKRRAELGAIAPIDIIQAESEMKAAQGDVTTAELRVLQQETIIKSVITRAGFDNPLIASAHVVPTDHFDIPLQEAIRPVQDLISEAMAQRPEVEVSRVGLDNSRINLLGTKSELMPQLSAFVNLANNAQAGQVNTLPVPLTDANGNPITVNGIPQYFVRTPANVNGFFLGGYGTVLQQLFNRDFPNYTAGFQLQMSLRNRSAQSDMITAELNLRQSQIQDKQLQNNIKMNVMNAAVALSQARSAYDTSVQARQLAEQTLAGTRRKYELGSSSFLDVLVVQRDTVARQQAEVTALNQYIRGRVSLETVTGRILDDNNVDMGEAYRGQVAREPDLIPAVVNKP